ncbi:hypothetical protein B0T20DRAFT_243349 [Sordaria brevicollis]|uniref:Uncharacterized protein n=1 Tax=Sordaria brevicollis TaxID=83679 RepID=A0AAE0PBK8_SORBR|nr:hypothetical protein B0T20DRAFT_243349 [Sordaria brevicollis]
MVALPSLLSVTSLLGFLGQSQIRSEKRAWDPEVKCHRENIVKVDGAVTCISKLLKKGPVPCETYKPTAPAAGLMNLAVNMPVWCHSGLLVLAPFNQANITGNEDKWPTCVEVAQTASVILDTCTDASDNKVAGEREKDLTGRKIGVAIRILDLLPPMPSVPLPEVEQARESVGP